MVVSLRDTSDSKRKQNVTVTYLHMVQGHIYLLVTSIICSTIISFNEFQHSSCGDCGDGIPTHLSNSCHHIMPNIYNVLRLGSQLKPERNVPFVDEKPISNNGPMSFPWSTFAEKL